MPFSQRTCAIYHFVNTRNQYHYVSSAVEIDERWYSHRWHLDQGMRRNPALGAAWKKTGQTRSPRRTVSARATRTQSPLATIHPSKVIALSGQAIYAAA
jgi:hypothetical protein